MLSRIPPLSDKLSSGSLLSSGKELSSCKVLSDEFSSGCEISSELLELLLVELSLDCLPVVEVEVDSLRELSRFKKEHPAKDNVRTAASNAAKTFFIILSSHNKNKYAKFHLPLYSIVGESADFS